MSELPKKIKINGISYVQEPTLDDCEEVFVELVRPTYLRHDGSYLELCLIKRPSLGLTSEMPSIKVKPGDRLLIRKVTDGKCERY